MGWLKRAGIIVAVAVALQPAMIILGLYTLFPDYFGSQLIYFALLLGVSIAGGSIVTKGIDVITTAIISAAAYIIIFRVLVYWLFAPLLVPGLRGVQSANFSSAPGFLLLLSLPFHRVNKSPRRIADKSLQLVLSSRQKKKGL